MRAGKEVPQEVYSLMIGPSPHSQRLKQERALAEDIGQLGDMDSRGSKLTPSQKTIAKMIGAAVKPTSE